jgi:hypothetical protein
VGEFLRGLQEVEVLGLSVQTDSIRKLIVSEVNMFKNIEYDLLNISRQMEAVSPQSQIECFVVSSKDLFRNPIISIYAEGPVANRYELIDFKFPIKRSLLEETLLRIDRNLFTWILENKVSPHLSRTPLLSATLSSDCSNATRKTRLAITISWRSFRAVLRVIGR